MATNRAQSPGDESGETEVEVSRKRQWIPPAIAELPRLTELTLQSGGPIVGGSSTVFF